MSLCNILIGGIQITSQQNSAATVKLGSCSWLSGRARGHASLFAQGQQMPWGSVCEASLWSAQQLVIHGAAHPPCTAGRGRSHPWHSSLGPSSTNTR